MTHLPTQPLLELVRPPAGWRTDRALLSAYSAEPAVLVAILLALAGRDDDFGKGSKVALARALTELNGRVAVVLQRGRLAAPRHAPRVLALLDRFVREVPWDEGAEGGAGRSWHAKVALVRQVPSGKPDGRVRWRFWLGSRNFTRDASWDIAFSVESAGPRARARTLPGMDRVAARLAAQAGQAGVWRPFSAELAAARWGVPAGLTVRRVALLLPDDAGRGIPEAPARTERLLAAAPFLDGGTVRALGAWCRQRELLSNIPELARVNAQRQAPLEGFELLALPAVPEDGAAAPEDDDATEEAAVEARGLHAKFLWAERRGGATLWLGSPNLTQRAWRRNAEAYVAVEASLRGNPPASRALYDGIEALRELARTVRPDDLGGLLEQDPVEEGLERARAEVAARLSGRQRRANRSTVVETDADPPHPTDPRVALDVGRLGGELRPWPRGAACVELPLLDGVETELLSLRVSLDGQRASWTQRVPFDPPLPPERDTEALSGYLGARGILDWISDELDGLDDREGGGDWDDEGPTGNGGGGAGAALDLPTVEKVLRAWGNDPARLAAVDRILRGTASTRRGGDETEARQHLDAFASSWKVLRAGLGGGRRRGA